MVTIIKGKKENTYNFGMKYFVQQFYLFQLDFPQSGIKCKPCEDLKCFHLEFHLLNMVVFE